MDSYNHYLIARYSWDYPSLFLDQWGKPIYTLIASAFVQFGMAGALVLNIVCLVGCSILVYRILTILNIRYAWLGYILCLASPIFLDNTISSLTEPLCALLVILTIYLYIDQRFIASAVLAGFLPFARSEGFIILFVIVLFLVFINKKYALLIYSLVGSLVFNILGWVIEGEPLWIITSNPYINFELSGKNVCGSGGLSHYFYAGHYTFGLVCSALIAVGAAIFLWRLYSGKKTNEKSIALVVVCFILYFGSHVAIWWLGKMGSCGYVRVMVVIAPLASIIILYGIHHSISILESKIGKYKRIVIALILAVLAANAVYTPYRYYAYKYPLQVSAEQREYQKLAQWYQAQDLQDRRKIYLYPYFSILADINPYDSQQHLDFWASSLQFAKEGDILIWDGHFGPHESGTPLLTLERDSSWQKIHSILPQEPIRTLNDMIFEIHVFEKIK